MPTFPTDVIAAVLAHMNSDHAADNLVIVRAFAAPSASTAIMTGLDAFGGDWSATVDGAARQVRIPWTIPVSERADIRRAVTLLYRDACSALGIDPRVP